MIAFAEVSIGNGGVVACRRCAAEAEVPVMYPSEDIAAKLRAAASSWRFGPGPNVSFVGAEPFRHPSLPDIIGAAAQLGFERIRLRTDAGALSRSGNAPGILDAGVRHLEVVLLGDTGSHDALSGRVGLFGLVEMGVAAFTTAAGQRGDAAVVSVLIPACRHNAAVLPEAVGAAARLGACAVVLDAGRLKRNTANEALVAAALQTATVNRVAGSVSGWDDASAAVYERPPWDSRGVAP